jgi:hypothetical protein
MRRVLRDYNGEPYESSLPVTRYESDETRIETSRIFFCDYTLSLNYFCRQSHLLLRGILITY